MGGAQSKTTTEILTDIAIGVVQETIARCSQVATQQQLIEVRNVVGDVIIGDVNMTQGMSVNMQCVLRADTQAEIQSDIAAEIAQQASSMGVGYLSTLGGGSSKAEAVIENFLNMTIDTTTIQETMMSSLQLQEISVANVGGNVIIAGVNMEQGMKMVANAHIEGTTYATAIATIATEIDQEVETKSDSPFKVFTDMASSLMSSYVMMMVGLALVGGLAFVFVFKYFVESGVASEVISVAAPMIEKKLGAGMIGGSYALC